MINLLWTLFVTTYVLECEGILLERPGQVPYTKSCKNECDERSTESQTCTLPLPRHYIAQYLDHHEREYFKIDGHIWDRAWRDVPWTDYFVDIRGQQYHAPYNTRFKVRWDDTNVYVGAILMEPQLWATETQKDSRVYEENAFEVFFDVDRSMSMYKEIEMNALGTTWDLILSRAYMDGGDWQDWEGVSDKAVAYQGTLNNGTGTDNYWTLEMAFPFSKLSENTTRSPGPATEGEMWFMQGARTEYDLETLPNGTYVKKAGTSTHWYSWTPMGAVNLHRPSKWGLLFFSKQNATTVPPEQITRWTTYQALFDIFEALVTCKAVRGAYVDEVRDLDLPPYITQGCFLSVDISLTADGFTVTLVSKDEQKVKGQIDQNRHVSFISS